MYELEKLAKAQIFFKLQTAPKILQILCFAAYEQMRRQVQCVFKSITLNSSASYKTDIYMTICCKTLKACRFFMRLFSPVFFCFKDVVIPFPPPAAEHCYWSPLLPPWSLSWGTWVRQAKPCNILHRPSRTKARN